MKLRLLSQMVKEALPSTSTIDYIIRHNHKHLIIYNQERQAYVLIDVNNYDSISENNNIYYIHTKEPILINQKSNLDTFEIDILGGDEVFGFHSDEDFLSFCKDKRLNTCNKISTKLIFSPQLANFLLDSGFHIIKLKEHCVTGQTIFVFKIEKDFNLAIDYYRMHHKENSNENN